MSLAYRRRKKAKARGDSIRITASTPHLNFDLALKKKYRKRKPKFKL